MDVILLHPETYLPDQIVDNYTSCIWHERYVTFGEFEIKTYDVERYQNMISEMSLLTHQETREVMYVEEMLTETDDEDLEVLTIKGFSVPNFSDHRFLSGNSQTKYVMPATYTSSEFLAVLLWNAFVNNTTNDVTRASGASRSPNDAIPNLVVSDSATVQGLSPKYRWWVSGGQIMPRLLEIMKARRLGIRTIRPPDASVTSIRVATDGSGALSYTTRFNSPAMRLDVYSGADRRVSQTNLDPVAFGGTYGGLSQASYLMSLEDYKNNGYVYSPVGRVAVSRLNTLDSELIGFARRSLWIDGGQPEDGQTNADFLADLPAIGLNALLTHNMKRLVDGQVSEDAQYIYGQDYGLGDRVTRYGPNGVAQDVWVSEYIRTDDAEGDRGYPTLVTSFD